MRVLWRLTHVGIRAGWSSLLLDFLLFICSYQLKGECHCCQYYYILHYLSNVDLTLCDPSNKNPTAIMSGA